MYKLVLFDLDGTLADTDYMVVDTYLELFKKYRPDYKPSFKELASLSGPTLKEAFAHYFPNEDMEMLLKEFRSNSESKYYTHTSLYKGIKEALIKLLQDGIKVGIVTNKQRNTTMFALELYGVKDLFTHMICADDLKTAKPHPDGIYSCLEYFGCSKEETLFVGDSKTDELTAINAGVDCMLVSWNLHGILKNTQPKYYVDTIDEMMEIIYGKSN